MLMTRLEMERWKFLVFRRAPSCTASPAGLESWQEFVNKSITDSGLAHFWLFFYTNPCRPSS
ncbi:hypothetical protein XFF6166_1020106 [Xanthomonas citri pv. fuscans]|nr:hypothetical protein XFF6166_1020106 [Xanthomonas citri pv. fuscans]SOO03249.1 hypothetical protein XFF6960_840001 [Xanthomonas citri pv. fuscans]SOO07304.1 hypothetical protein XFF7767_960001 [Xanthomonas citri pv. fuscans]SOO11999.1 hypothetical protein XFF6970_990108 [Xanthomonas citri pv. fuscans]SOO12242.1 hypothetical protein XFF7766_1060001 [Xanthomonas citri pv. fuscans]